VLSQYHRGRYGRDLASMVARALELPDDALPEKGEAQKWIRDKALEARIQKLKRVRDAKAKELNIDPGILSPRHVLAAIATTGTLDVPAMRDWQRSVVGHQLLGALGS
jgi:ribonuclease D